MKMAREAARALISAENCLQTIDDIASQARGAHKDDIPGLRLAFDAEIAKLDRVLPKLKSVELAADVEGTLKLEWNK